MAEENDPKEEKAKRPFPKLVILGILVVALGAGGYFAWNMFIAQNKPEKQISEHPQIEEQNKTAAIPLDSFIINLMDKSGSGKRYLKVGIILEISRQEQRSAVEKFKPQIRDTILLLLSSKSFDDVATIAGKRALKRGILNSVNKYLASGRVLRVYFSDFVVQ